MKRVLSILSLTLVLVMCLFMFASCGYKSYAKKLEKAGYTVTEATDEQKEAAQKMYGDEYKLKEMCVAVKGTDTVTIVKLGSKKQVKNLVEEMKLSDGTYEIKGSCLLIGTKDAINAALGK